MNSGSIIIPGSSAIAVISYGDVSFVFDSDSRNEQGCSSIDRTSVVLIICIILRTSQQTVLMQMYEIHLKSHSLKLHSLKLLEYTKSIKAWNLQAAGAKRRFSAQVF